jgi:hypothetical protein
MNAITISVIAIVITAALAIVTPVARYAHEHLVIHAESVAR